MSKAVSVSTDMEVPQNGADPLARVVGLRLAEELQAEVDKFKYDTAADMEYVNAIRERVTHELVWLDVHKDPDIFSRETVLSPSSDPVSQLWNHVTGQFRAWERAPQPPKHFQGMLPAEFTAEQYAEARRRVRTYNRSIARAIQTEDERARLTPESYRYRWSEINHLGYSCHRIALLTETDLEHFGSDRCL